MSNDEELLAHQLEIAKKGMFMWQNAAMDLGTKLRNAVETLKWYAEWDWSKDEYNEGISTRATFCLKELESE